VSLVLRLSFQFRVSEFRFDLPHKLRLPGETSS